MRLDLYLVKFLGVPSRSKAKLLISKGYIKVNGKIIRDPAYDVKPTCKVEILDESLADKPSGYYKLKALDEKLNIFSGKEVVLDIGSSAGGFLLYASEHATRVYGVEISEEFIPTLKELEKMRHNIVVTQANVFERSPFVFTKGERVDVLLIDLSLNIFGVLKALERCLKVLKKNGKVLVCFKLAGMNVDAIKQIGEKFLNSLGLEIKEWVSLEKQEIFAYCIKKT